MSTGETLHQMLEEALRPPAGTELAVGTISEAVGNTAFVSVPGDQGSLRVNRQKAGEQLATGDEVLLVKPSRAFWMILGRVVPIGERSVTSAIQVGIAPVPEDRTELTSDDRVTFPADAGIYMFLGYRDSTASDPVIAWVYLDTLLSTMLAAPPGAGNYYLEVTGDAGRGFASKQWLTGKQLLTKLIPYRSTPPAFTGNGALWLDTSS